MAETVEFRCPHCNQLYRLGREQLARYSGKVSNCRKCQQPFTFPEAAAPHVPQEPHEQAMTSMVVGPSAAGPSAVGPAQEAGEPPPVPAGPPAGTPPAPATAARRGPTLADLLSFRYMITGPIMQVLFWVGTALCVVAGIVAIVGALSQDARRYDSPPAWLGVVAGLLLIVLGPVVVRIHCELLIVMFRIYDTLVEMRDELRRR